MLTFMVSRFYFGLILHFKDWYRCLLWSMLILASLFSVLKMNLFIAMMFASFSAYIMTGKSNIDDMYLWNNHDEPSKYKDVLDFINQNPDKIKEFEIRLKNYDLEFKIYNLRFKEGKTFKDISDLLDLQTPKIVIYLDKIAFAIRLFYDIE